MTSGICRLCGQNTLLSFEHVPPRTTFNKNTKYSSIEFEDYIKTENPLKTPPKGKIKQGGIGYNSFCEKCNSFLGTEYVPAYKLWVDCGFHILQNKEFELHTYTIKNVQPQKILKQIVSMFLAINGEWFLESYPELSNFVASKDSNELPERYKIFCYLTRAENVRYMHHVIQGNFLTGSTIKCSEIAFPPYGYVLTMDSNIQNPYLNNISEFKNLDKTRNLEIRMFQLPTYMPLPLDYRTKEQVEKEIEKGIQTTRTIKENNKTNS